MKINESQWLGEWVCLEGGVGVRKWEQKAMKIYGNL
jgi:hypothetical protein